MRQLLLPVNMQLSTVLTSALAALAIASPAKPKASTQSRSLADVIFNNLNLPRVPLEDFNDFRQCMIAHRTFDTDYSKADDGVFTITHVDHTCCEKAEGLWSQVQGDQYGKAVFTQLCDGATVTGVSRQHMGMLRGLFDSI